MTTDITKQSLYCGFDANSSDIDNLALMVRPYSSDLEQYFLKYDVSGEDHAFFKEMESYPGTKNLEMFVGKTFETPKETGYYLNRMYFLLRYIRIAEEIKNATKPNIKRALEDFKNSPERQEALAKAIEDRGPSQPQITDPMLLDPVYRYATSIGATPDFTLENNEIKYKFMMGESYHFLDIDEAISTIKLLHDDAKNKKELSVDEN